MKKVTAQELKERFEEAKKQPLPEGIVVTCTCGKHDVNKLEFSDEDYEEMARIVNGESPKETP